MSVIENTSPRAPQGPPPALAADPASRRVTVIEPSRGLAGLNLAELWAYRDLLVTLAERDVKLRYRQTAVGVAWVVLQPLLTSLVLTVVFGILGHLSTDGIPPFIFCLAGTIGFNLFTSTLVKANASLVGNANLVSKIYFPRIILPLSTAYSSLIDFGVGLLVTLVLVLCYHRIPTFAFFGLLLWVPLFLMIAVGVGLYLAAITVRYRDVQYNTPIFIQLLTFASPVGYSILHPSPGTPRWIMPFWRINPLTGLLEGIRWSLLGSSGNPPAPGSVLFSAVFAVVVLLGGIYAFRNMERGFADVI